MKIKSALYTALLAFSASVFASDEPQTISGSIWRDGNTRATFDLRVRDGETQHAALHGGETLEVSRSEETGTLVRVLAPSGKQLASASLGAESSDKSVRFAFCAKGGVEVSSPAFTATPHCEAE